MSSSRPAASSHARFIPREELFEFAAWTPGAFGDRPGAPSGPSVASATPAAPAPPTEAEWQERVKAARQQGWTDGYRDGQVALENFKQQFAAQTSAQFGAIVSRLDAQWDGLEQEMARAVTRTAVQLARQVVRCELAVRPEIVARVAQEAVNAIVLSARHLRLRVNPGDLAHVLQGADDAIKGRDVRLLADAAVEAGGCVLESDLGQIDARIASRWAQAAAVYGCDDAWAATDADGGAGGGSASDSDSGSDGDAPSRQEPRPDPRQDTP